MGQFLLMLKGKPNGSQPTAGVVAQSQEQLTQSAFRAEVKSMMLLPVPKRAGQCSGHSGGAYWVGSVPLNSVQQWTPLLALKGFRGVTQNRRPLVGLFHMKPKGN